jgi:tetratricopeptide (TPR) repeat protein
VQAILAARIDRLAPEDKQLWQTAAVIGKDVPYALLAAIADLPEDEMRQRLANLQAAEFLYEANLFPDLEYTFKHALTHEVAYASLLQERRKTLHARILEALERIYADRVGERVEQLGHHALRAEHWEKAVEYLRQSGVKALERSANREAAGAFEHALGAIERLPQTREIVAQTTDLHLAMRPCVTPLADMNRLLEHARRAAPLVASLADGRREALICMYQVGALNNIGKPQQALELATRALAAAQDLDDPLLQLQACYFAGQVQNVVGSFPAAIELFERHMELPRGTLDGQTPKHPTQGLDIRSAVISYLFTKTDCSLAHAELGNFHAARERATEAAGLARAAGLTFLHGMAEMQPGRVHLRIGEPRLAISFLERSVELAKEIDFPLVLINAAPELGYAYNLVQRSPEAVLLLENAWSLAETGAFLHYGVMCLMHLADAYSLTGQEAHATATIDRALTIARDAGYRAREAWALYLQGNVLGRAPQANVVEARKAQEAALALASELGMRPLIGHCHLGLGSLHAAMGDKAAARTELQAALSMYREMEMQHWPEQAEAELRKLG